MSIREITRNAAPGAKSRILRNENGAIYLIEGYGVDVVRIIARCGAPFVVRRGGTDDDNGTAGLGGDGADHCGAWPAFTQVQDGQTVTYKGMRAVLFARGKRGWLVSGSGSAWGAE